MVAGWRLKTKLLAERKNDKQSGERLLWQFHIFRGLGMNGLTSLSGWNVTRKDTTGSENINREKKKIHVNFGERTNGDFVKKKIALGNRGMSSQRPECVSQRNSQSGSQGAQMEAGEFRSSESNSEAGLKVKEPKEPRMELEEAVERVEERER